MYLVFQCLLVRLEAPKPPPPPPPPSPYPAFKALMKLYQPRVYNQKFTV